MQLFDLSYELKGEKEIVSSLGNAMELKPGRGKNFILFSEKEPEDLLKYFPAGNLPWKIYNNDRVKLAYHRIFKDIIIKSKGFNLFNAKFLFFPIWLQVIEKGGLIAHCSFIVKDGKGILLIGSNGSGKSTCYRRFPGGWEKISDDWAVISGDGFQVSPWPTWSHLSHKLQEDRKSWDISRKYPLSALFFIEKGKRQKIKRLRQSEVTLCLINSIKELLHSDLKNLYKPERINLMKQIFENAWNVSGKIPGYSLTTTLKGRFWDLIKGVI